MYCYYYGFAYGTACDATLQIKNDDIAQVDIPIEDGYCNILNPGKEPIRLVLKEGEQKTLGVKKSCLDIDTLSIVGEVKMPSLQ